LASMAAGSNDLASSVVDMFDGVRRSRRRILLSTQNRSKGLRRL
jgi:hypothetical protein